MTALALASLGAVIGALARFALGGWIAAAAPGAFPWGTLTINLAGCLVAGYGFAVAETQGWAAEARVFFFVGLLGSFTTFSSFGLETLRLFRGGEAAAGMAYVAASNLGGLALCWLGFSLARGIHA